jgi:hypothetical protein
MAARIRRPCTRWGYRLNHAILWDVATSTAVSSQRSRRRIDPKLLAASLVIAVGLVLIGYALLRAVTGDEAANLPPAVEEVTPTPSAIQVPQQSQIVADLKAGYEGRLVIDGVQLPTIRLDQLGSVDIKPGEQIDVPPGVLYEPGNATLTYTPSENAPIERFESGPHTVTVIYWLSEQGPSRARSFTWTFTSV